MEEEARTASGEVEAKLLNNSDIMVGGDEGEVIINGDAHKQRKEGNKEDSEEEIALDGGFIKIEKESIDVKESSQTQKTILEAEEASSRNVDPETSVTSIDSSEMEEKIKALQLQVETVTKELNHSDSEKLVLKSEVDLSNEKVEKMEKICEELELDRKRMKEQIIETEQKYHLQLQSLEEAFGAVDVKHKELVDVKEAFNELSAELDSSRKKIEELEINLVSSAAEARKFEDLSKDRSSIAESETKKALEFEKMLEVAKLTAKDMEDQIGNLQEELTGLYHKIAENQQIEEALSKTTTELAVLQEKLDLSKSQVEDLEQKLVSRGATIDELTEELNTRKTSEEQMREDVHALENLLFASKEDLQAMVGNIEKIELKLQEEMKVREKIEASLKDQETQASTLTEELQNMTNEKETLQNTVADLNSNILLGKELCGELEAKLDLADQNFNKTNLLLSQALSHKEELEEKLKSLEVFHNESRDAVESTTQRNLELDGLIQAAHAAEEEVKAQLKDAEKRLVATEGRNMEIEQKLTLAELKCAEADREIKELRDKKSELTSLLRDIEEESALSKCQFQAYDDRVSQLESSLNQSYSRNSELQEELKDLAKKSAEHEGRAMSTHQRSLELEELVHISHSKAEDAGSKVSELELLLEAANHRTQELEHLLSNAEAKHKDAEAESKQHNSRVSDLSAELESIHTKSSSLEAVLQAANEKERELTDILNSVTEEKKKLEDVSTISDEKLLQAEKVIVVLQTELKCAQDKLETVEKDLESAGMRENEILKKLKSAEEQLEHHGRAVEQGNARILDLETAHEHLAKDSELKLQEAIVRFTQKDSEAKQLHEKLVSLEEQATFHQDQATKATGDVASLKAELEANAMKFSALESSIEDLKREVSETEIKAELAISENGLLASTNSKLQEELEAHQSKVNELHELLSSVQAAKEATAEQLSSHVNAISELTDEHSRGLELQSATESRIKETEVELHEAIERLTQIEFEAKDLNEKLLAVENQLRIYEEQFSEVTSIAESRKRELEEAFLKLQKSEGLVKELQSKVTQFETDNESLASANLRLSQELAALETKMNELQMALNAAIAEKEDTLVQLHGSRETIEDVTQQLASEGEKLQSQISSIMEENNMLNQMQQDAKRELQAVTIQMEEQMNNQKSREISLNADVDSLKTELGEKSLMQAHISELKQNLVSVETKYAEEMESLQSAVAEKETVLTSKLEEHTSILGERDDLDEKLKEFQKELKLAHDILTEQKELVSKKEAEREAIAEKSKIDMKSEHQRADNLEEQVEDLKKKLQIAEARYIEKDEADLDNLKLKLSQTAELEKQIAELKDELKLANTKLEEQAKDGTVETGLKKDGVEVKSRDFELGTSTQLKRKSKKRIEGSHQTTEAIPANSTVTATTPVPSGPMAFKFIIGVALVSVIIGVILGKRY